MPQSYTLKDFQTPSMIMVLSGACSESIVTEFFMHSLNVMKRKHGIHTMCEVNARLALSCKTRVVQPFMNTLSQLQSTGVASIARE